MNIIVRKGLHIGKVLVEIFQDKYVIYKERKAQLDLYKKPQRIEIAEEVTLTLEQEKAIDKFYKENYGKKIPYIWHKTYTAYTSKFDVQYFPELLYIPEFEHYMNQWPVYNAAMYDKNVISVIAKSVEGVKTPWVYLSCVKGAFRNSDNQLIDKEKAIELVSNIGMIFAKPTVDCGGGSGCFIADFHNGMDSVSGKSAEEIICQLGNDFVIQERVKCHETISKIYSGSVNTFRIMTYRWKDKVFSVPAIMRIGRGGHYLDNAHQGGMFIAIDGDGAFHSCAYTEFKEVYTEHPDSGVIFSGYRIPLFPSVVEAAIKMHSVIPQIGVVNWDFTLNEKGEPVLIEANMNAGGIWVFEMAHGCGAFGERTAEILRWMQFMRKTSPRLRKKYAFGKMDEK